MNKNVTQICALFPVWIIITISFLQCQKWPLQIASQWYVFWYKIFIYFSTLQNLLYSFLYKSIHPVQGYLLPVKTNPFPHIYFPILYVSEIWRICPHIFLHKSNNTLNHISFYFYSFLLHNYYIHFFVPIFICVHVHIYLSLFLNFIFLA